MIAQLRHFEARLPPFDLPYVAGMDTPKIWWSSFKNQPRHLAELALRIFSINPTQASCERNFSTLKWILGERRTNLSLNRLERMAKIRLYYMTNIQHELSFFEKELTEHDLRDACNMASVGSIMSCEEDQIRVNEENLLDVISNHSTTLLIEKIVDLTAERNSESSARTTQIISPADLDYDSQNVLNSFL